MNATFQVPCPHCKFENTFVTEKQYLAPRLVYCNVEEGGCDQPFVFKAEVKLSVTVELFTIHKEDLFDEELEE
jgi:hypothetical protein